jgi:hypothetical protein
MLPVYKGVCLTMSTAANTPSESLLLDLISFNEILILHITSMLH